MANEQDIVDAIRQLQNDNAQMLRTLQQMSSAIQQLARSGGARAGGVNAGPQNPNSLKDRLLARTKNQAERSVAIKAGRALIGPAEQAFDAAGAGIGAALSGAGSGSGIGARISRAVAQTLGTFSLGNAVERSESVIGRAESRVGSANEDIVRQGGTLSAQALEFQNRLALTQERRVQAFRDRQSASFTNLSKGEREFQTNRTLAGITGDEQAPFTSGLNIDGFKKALEDAQKGLEKFKDALDPRSVH